MAGIIRTFTKNAIFESVQVCIKRPGFIVKYSQQNGRIWRKDFVCKRWKPLTGNFIIYRRKHKPVNYYLTFWLWRFDIFFIFSKCTHRPDNGIIRLLDKSLVIYFSDCY